MGTLVLVLTVVKRVRLASWREMALALLCALAMGASHALEINQASEAELDSLRGMGPALSRAILAQRQAKAFSDWADLMHRVKGIGAANAQRFAAQGLTVNGQVWPAQPPSGKP
ncbi:MAG: helix-hairpin-helix domain-containing protein [Betaproteobacteria bacterium]|nr:helix-hairpin-helix domain-containing protein [Betaproteobacteria bacterium]NBY04420.1 helix-hairpin-helix domain-containing protein [Betaproteobacteria bacterium]